MKASPLLQKVRTEKPLVHHITNWVTIYDCANVVKVFGASPVMAHAKEEVADMVQLASSLVLNIGTLTTELVESMILAARAANNKGLPIVLDVCGAGATPLRDHAVGKILDSARISIIKGNASEIARTAGLDIQTKGVDSTDVQQDMTQLAQKLANKWQATVVVTGREDLVTNGQRLYKITNGTEIMSRIVGTGCMATSVIGTFAAIHSELSEAAAAGLCCFEVAAELAATENPGPGTFKEALFDRISTLTLKQVDEKQRIICD